MASMFGNRIKISLFGQSHGEQVGAVLDGIKAGEKIDMELLQAFVQTRSSRSNLTTRRQEKDDFSIVSGIVDGYTCGAPICILFKNKDVQSSDYEKNAHILRPSHADYPAFVKHKGCNDSRGGGHFSARITAPLCACGGILIQLLEKKGIKMGAHLYNVGHVYDTPFDYQNVSEEVFNQIEKNNLPVIKKRAEEEIEQLILQVKEEKDSVGGCVECAILHLEAGLGEPYFEGIDSILGQLLFSLNAVKGVEFGAGVLSSTLKGSENNDAYALLEGQICIKQNNAGGVLGGLTSSAPLVVRCHFKPTPSISKAQNTVDIEQKKSCVLKLDGRHDPCVALRAVPCVLSMCALAVSQFVL